MKKALQTIFNLALHLIAIAILAWVFWPFVNRALHVPRLTGNDAEQFIHLVHYFQNFLPLPPAGWDHLWYEGVPRVLDSTFLHYYLIQPLVAIFDLALATQIYPLIWLGIFFLFSYLALFRLSRNHLIALVLTAGLIQSQSVYLQIYKKGVVISGLAQMVFPLILFFLVSFGQTGSFRFLALAALSLAFMFYSHGAMALVFGLTSAILFLAFCRVKEEKLLSWIRVRRLLIFTSMTVGMAAIAILPQVFSALNGEVYGRFPRGQVLAQLDILGILLKETNSALFVGLGLAVLAAIIFYKRQKPSHLIIPLAALLAYILIFQTTLALGINPLSDFLFPERSFWYFALILAAISALLLAPLSQTPKRGVELFFPLGWIVISGVIMAVVLMNQVQAAELLPSPTSASLDKVERNTQLISYYKDSLNDIWNQVNHDDKNYRVWLHAFPKIYWNIVSDVPQVEGYFHFYTEYSGDWTAWLFATLAEETVENQTIPQNMAEGQALFLIDWYGIKYLIPFPGPEFNLAPRFWGENEYILKKSAEGPPAVLTMKPDFTSGIVEAVDVPLVGFVGSDEGYDAFLRDLGMLNLNTHYLIPLRLTSSINKLAKTDLDKVDLLVLYNFEGGGGNWRKLADFVKKGGNLFIETGGNPSLREGTNLPEVFPAEQLEFGSLGKEWQVETKEGLSAIDFTKLEPLVYQDEPWKVSYVPDPNLIREGSRVLVAQVGKPVVVERKLGQGKIIWSGLNSWYRPWEFKANGMVEVQVLDVILTKLLETSYQPGVEVEVIREKPEKITVEGNNFSGVVFKENHLPGWKAWVNVNGKKQNLKIYSAGPDLMFASLPQELEDKPAKVSFVYQGPWSYWLLFFISIVSFILVMVEIITNGYVSRRLRLSRMGKIIDTKKHFKTIRGWWDKEEE